MRERENYPSSKIKIRLASKRLAFFAKRNATAMQLGINRLFGSGWRLNVDNDGSYDCIVANSCKRPTSPADLRIVAKLHSPQSSEIITLHVPLSCTVLSLNFRRRSTSFFVPLRGVRFFRLFTIDTIINETSLLGRRTEPGRVSKG